MTYLQSLQYLESFINYEKISFWSYKKSLRLERFQDFLTIIGNPQEDLRCVHIAGTKGKGSTSAFTAYILREAGYKTGLYTSPHLLDFRERIRILKPLTASSSPRPAYRVPQPDFEGMISTQDFTRLVFALKPAIEEYNRASKYGPLSFFEACTALAFVYFKTKGVDFVVLETGLGGRLDATNVVNPLVCAITPISLEHTQYLGDTLKKIAIEKAGIIKSRCQVSGVRCQPIVISALQEKEALGVIKARCRETGAKLYEVGKDIRYQGANRSFEIRGVCGRYNNLKIKLIGRHQLINAAVSLGIIEALRFYGVKVSLASIKNGLYNTYWPGRCEIISKRPFIVLDGAQNAASSRVLSEVIRENFSSQRLILILGISEDKDIKGVCQELIPLADELILTQADNPRAASVDFIEKIIRDLRTLPSRKALLAMTPFENQIIKTKNVQEAKRFALGLAKKEDLILVAGSLFVVGEFRELL